MPRWLRASFSSSVISPKVRPSCSKMESYPKPFSPRDSKAMVTELLPSASIYSPLGNTQHTALTKWAPRCSTGTPWSFSSTVRRRLPGWANRAE